MSASTIIIQSKEENVVAGDIKLQVVKGFADAKPNTSVIPITEKVSSERINPVNDLSLITGYKPDWQMPPVIRGYIKGRDNDPL